MNAGLSVVVACDRRSSAVATRSIGMHASASEAKIWSAQILMLSQAAGESEEGPQQTYAFARRRDGE
jgi:hypothetical protein